MLKKLSVLPMLVACLGAAEFWESKPFPQWNDKEVEKVLSDSPWAKKYIYELSNRGPGDGGGGGAKGGGGGGGGKGKGGGGGGGASAGQEPPSIPTATVLMRWVTALPVKRALMKRKFGDEAATSAEAQKNLERVDEFYVLYVATSPQAARGLKQAKDAIIASSSLNVKGKDSIKAQDIQFGATEGVAEMYLLFPRAAALSVDDKEVEFSSKFGSLNVKYKFKLKDMVYNGKLEI